MTRNQQPASIAKLACVVPTVLVVLAVDFFRQAGVSVPVPIFIIIICVIVAGAMGGQRSGLIAGVIAALFLVRAYFVQFGPPALTGGLPQVALGSVLFILIGVFLGRLRDQRDSSIQGLRARKQDLEATLRTEVTKNSRNEALVSQNEARLATAIRIAGIGHFRFETATGDCLYCSEQHAAHFGLTPEEFCKGTEGPDPELFYVHEDDRHIVIDAITRIKSGEIQVFEYRGLHSNGEIKYIYEIVEPILDANGKVIEEVGTSIDQTELRQAEQRLRQQQRFEAIGTLTGGIAHDFNNLLAVILGNLELVLDTEPDGESRDYIEASIKATMRGADLTKNLLSFSRRAHLEPRLLNLNQLIQDTTGWSTRVLPETIAVENSLMAGLWDVELDASSTENALINILLNARDAMEGRGRIAITTANKHFGEDGQPDQEETIEPGRYVMLEISDTGHGIPPDKIEKIFEPFYTNKPVGQGSGLGLSMVHGFIKQSGGSIRVHSEVDVGTTIRLYFKAATKNAGLSETKKREEILAPNEQIEVLFAEDEVGVRRVLRRILESAGYRVTTASSGDEALKIFKFSGPFDLLLSDIVMPGDLQGPALAKAIRSIDPDLPCVFLSGYASKAIVRDDGVEASDTLLMKPVSRSVLLDAVAKALKSTKNG